jgi:hypothetical protein
METKKCTCSVCGLAGHNKRSCPHIPIEDTIDDTTDDIIEERLNLSKKKVTLIGDLLDRQSYDIPVDVFKIWLPKRQCCKQNEVKHILNMGFNKDSVNLYLDLIDMIDQLY